MVGKIKIISLYITLSLLGSWMIRPGESYAATGLPYCVRQSIIEATQKACTQLQQVRTLQQLEDDAMIPLHSYRIKAGGLAFLIYSGSITLYTIFISPVCNVFISSVYAHVNSTLCMLCAVTLAFVYCYERFYYRQREAYPPCGFLFNELSHTYINAFYIRDNNNIISIPRNISRYTIHQNLFSIVSSLIQCVVPQCVLMPSLKHTHIQIPTKLEEFFISIPDNHEVRL